MPNIIYSTKESNLLSSDDWFIFLERKQPLFLMASFIKPYHGFFIRKIGHGFKKQIHIIRKDNSFYIRSQKESDFIKSSLAKYILKKENHEKIKKWFDKGIEFNKWADSQIDHYKKTSDRDLKDTAKYKSFLNGFYDLLFYSTILPYWTMIAADEIIKTSKNIDDINWAHDVIKIFTPLRADTRYPQVIDGIMNKYWIYLSEITSLPLSKIQLLLPDELTEALMDPASIRNIKNLDKRESCIFGILPNQELFFDFSQDSINKFLPKTRSNLREISGTIAHSGVASGVVKIVNIISDIRKVNKGDIIVSINTSPSLTTALKKSIGIITDEGGISCHAAIISRELGIPCIIGTKVATKILKDGDYVKIDANKGIVKILKKSKE